MALTRQEIALRASRVRSANARRRRFQRYVREMRQAGLIVVVREGVDGSAETRLHPDYALAGH
jgi:hypothetical protein